jgi:hypothetical protein
MAGTKKAVMTIVSKKDVSGDTKKNAVDRWGGCRGGRYSSGGYGAEAHCLVIDSPVL